MGILQFSRKSFFNHPSIWARTSKWKGRHTKAEIIEVIRAANGDDSEVERWFLARPQHTQEKIFAWNQLARNIGKEGFPVRQGFLWVIKHYYGGVAPDPRVDSAFTAIAFDEGYLDDLPQ